MNRLILAAFLALIHCAQAEPAEEETAAREKEPREPVRCVNDWTRVANGIEYRTLNCTRAGFDLHLVRVDPRVAAIDAVVRPGSTATDLGREYAFAINANFFDERFRALGLVVTSGKQTNPLHPVSWQSVFYVDREGTPRIVPMKEWPEVARTATAASQCGPRLVIGGEKNKVLKAEPSWRSGVCIDGEKRAVFFATPHEAAFDVHQMVALASGPLACKDAMLFDGGPSVQMFLRGRVNLEGDKRVPAYVVAR